MGASLRLLVINSGLNLRVSCSLCLGPWVITSVTCLGGRPHAEAIGVSKLGREIPHLVVSSSLPCCNFDDTPPCCCFFLVLRPKLVLLSLNEEQREAVDLLRRFCSVGWVSFEVLKPSVRGVRTCRDLASKIGCLNSRLLISRSVGVGARQKSTGLVLAANAVNDDSGLMSRANAVGDKMARVALCPQVKTSSKLMLSSSVAPVWWSAAVDCWRRLRRQPSVLSCARWTPSSKLAAKMLVFCGSAGVWLLVIESGLLLTWAWKRRSKLLFSSAVRWAKVGHGLVPKWDAGFVRRLFVKLEALDVCD
ncbi:MAG: hypothetical protein ACKERG_04505 [Candidatus Hodgkinia cicadicola]